jgi:predicted LPLAT superfamily acyltransferase
MVGLYLGGNRYQINFEPLADFSNTPTDQRVAAVATAVERYTALLDQYCRQAPYNWFNFFDFWQTPTAASDTK